jgi:hypothetical protein
LDAHPSGGGKGGIAVTRNSFAFGAMTAVNLL